MDRARRRLSRNRDTFSALVHLLLFSGSLLAAFVLAHDFARTEQWFFAQFMVALPAFLLIKYAVFSVTGQHQCSWRYVGSRDVFAVSASCAVASAVLLGLLLLLRTFSAGSRLAGVVDFPAAVVVIDWLLTVSAVLGFRLIIRHALELTRESTDGRALRTLVIGAGDAGETLLREIRRIPLRNYEIIGLLDDDDAKLGTRIHGIEVIGSIDTVREICTVRRVEQVLIAMPSAPRRRIREIIERCEGAGVALRIVPGLAELIEGPLTIESQLRHVRVEDLLHRDPVVLDHGAIGEYLHGKTVMVTGAGGSIGSEMCRQIVQFAPRRVVLVELSENNLFDIDRELKGGAAAVPLVSYLADICDRPRMRTIFHREQPDIVCHAAAHKHVPMVEANPGEGLKNNIVGTKTLAELAVEHGVRRFVFISTDKAVNPTSIMGCTKRVAEMYVQELSERTATQFITVRFGNVLNSRGSVVPIFQQQIARGGPLTITHPEITRYFMTIPEAAQLVLQAGAIGRGGEIFLLEMGEPVKIVDLARNLITLSGLTPEVDIDIEFTGLRPGEKLFEELYIEGEGLSPTSHPNIRVWRKRSEDWQTLVTAISRLVRDADRARAGTIKYRLRELVPEYSPDEAAGQSPPRAGDAQAEASLEPASSCHTES